MALTFQSTVFIFSSSTPPPLLPLPSHSLTLLPYTLPLHPPTTPPSPPLTSTPTPRLLIPPLYPYYPVPPSTTPPPPLLPSTPTPPPHLPHQMQIIAEKNDFLPKPAYCPDSIYQLMEKCCNSSPAFRPSTHSIIKELFKALTDCLYTRRSS